MLARALKVSLLVGTALNLINSTDPLGKALANPAPPTEAAPPPAQAVQMVALEHTLRLARSAH